MKYQDFKKLVHEKLLERTSGMTWEQLKDDLHLPYNQPCPEWTHCLEKEIGLVRRKGADKAFIWSLQGLKRRE
jgi:hypothetical protein